MESNRELDIPLDATEDAGAHEVLRVWTGNTEYVCITGKLYKDPETWGHLLSRIAQHVGRAYELNGFNSREEVLSKIHRKFNETWTEPDDGTGGLASS